MNNVLKKLRIYMQLFLQQLRLRYRFILVYVFFWFLMTVMFAAVYPFLKDNSEAITNVVGAFEGTGLAEAFGITEDYVASTQDFVGGEQLTIYAMVAAAAAAILGASSIGGSINNKQIFFLLTKPISRGELFCLHFAINSFTVILMNILVTAVTWVGFAIFVPSDLLSVDFVYSILVGFSVISVFFVAVGQMISLIFEPSMSMGVAVGIAVFGELLDGLSQIDGFPFWIQLFNPFYYLNTTRMTQQAELASDDLVLLLLCSAIMLIAGLSLFRNKQIYV